MSLPPGAARRIPPIQCLLTFEALIQRDYPIMFGSLYVFTLIGLIVKLIGDLTYVWVDPRIDFATRDVG